MAVYECPKCKQSLSIFQFSKYQRLSGEGFCIQCENNIDDGNRESKENQNNEKVVQTTELFQTQTETYKSDFVRYARARSIMRIKQLRDRERILQSEYHRQQCFRQYGRLRMTL